MSFFSMVWTLITLPFTLIFFAFSLVNWIFYLSYITSWLVFWLLVLAIIAAAVASLVPAIAEKNPHRQLTQDVLGLLAKSASIIVDEIMRQIKCPQKSLKGEVMVITGGGSGIGRLQALKFAQEGVTVVLWDMNIDGANAVAKEVMAAGGKASAYQCDVTDRAAVYALADKVKSEVGAVTMLSNNAGIVTGKKLLDAPDALCEKTMQVNSIAHFWTVKAFLPDWIEANHGHLITIASSAGTGGVPGLADYCASKWAAIGFQESMRLELKALKKDGVKTLCVNPYFINTGMFDGCKTRFDMLLPILDPDLVAAKIVQSTKEDQEVLALPHFVKIAVILRGLLPVKLFDEVGFFFGLSNAMDDFKGGELGSRAKSSKAD